MNRPGLYVHIPFCQRKCLYCDFVSYPLTERGRQEQIEAYVRALLQEMVMRRRWLEEQSPSPAPFYSVYIGGGTPTVLGTCQLTKILQGLKENFCIIPGAEVTLEANPGTVTGSDLAILRALGVNRLSIGVQSLDDIFLQRLGRIHTARDAEQTFAAARAAGFANINLDLMFGLPGETFSQWQKTLAAAVAWGPEHLACYNLTIEPATPFGRLQTRGKLQLPPEDTQVQMMKWTKQYLTGKGYIHYEISNYAQPGYSSRHNRIYWYNEPYLGLGVAAFSYWQGRRWGNTADITTYCKTIAAGSLPEAESETLDGRGQAGETVILALRMQQGLSLARFRARFGISVWDLFEEEIEHLLAEGMLELSHGTIRLTERAIPVANQVLSHFV